MRITNFMLVNDLRRNLNNNLERMDEYQRQLSTGRVINKPSDNPAGIVKSLRLRTSLVEGDQYLDNIGEAVNFMQTTDSACNDINEVLQKIRELTVKAATGTNDTDSNQAIAKQVAELNNQLMMIANSTYGSKYIFSGTNVTEAPYQDGVWVGNNDYLNMEVGAGIKVPVNLMMQEFFMGRLRDTYINPKASFINKIEAENLREGDYQIKTSVGPQNESVAREQQSYLGSTSNNKCFFYQSKDILATPGVTPATLGVGDVTNANNSSYNGSLLLEAKRIQPAWINLNEGSDKNGGKFTLTKPLYTKNSNGDLVPINDETDLTNCFSYTGAGSLVSAVYRYDANTGIATINFETTPGNPPPPEPPVNGDTIIWNNDWDADANDGRGDTVPGCGKNKVFDRNGDEYKPVVATYNGTSWNYDDPDDSAKILVDIKGHLYTSNGNYNYVELENVTVDLEKAQGEAIFTISKDAIGDPDFTEDLVIWNNGTDTLGGISPYTPEIAVGDKTVISLSAQGTDNAQSVDVGYTYKDIKGEQIGAGNHNFVFTANTLDNKLNEFKFFTLDEETGLSYDGSVTLETGAFQASADGAVRFDYEAGLFGYVADLTRRIEVGKLPQVGNELTGNDTRMKELLFYRSTIGARINRLELQQSRLEYTQESFTALLSKNEDANEAEVILNLKLQENVYRSSLAAGARIIMPTLIDFLR